MIKEELKKPQYIALGIVIIISLLIYRGSEALWSVVAPTGVVVSGTADNNLKEVAGKAVSTSADGIQKVSVPELQAAQDPCFANKLENFNKVVSSTMTALLSPTTEILHICGIHVARNTTNDVTITIIEGGGVNCAADPTVLAGDPEPSRGIRIGPGFSRGDAGATVFKTTKQDHTVCAVIGSGAGNVIVSGTYIKG